MKVLLGVALAAALAVAGPTAQSRPLVYHRGPGYGKLLREVTEQLQRLFRTKNDVLVFTSSGTGALESSVANMAAGAEALGPVHAVVANAGVAGPTQPLHEMTLADWRDTVATDLD